MNASAKTADNKKCTRVAKSGVLTMENLSSRPGDFTVIWLRNDGQAFSILHRFTSWPNFAGSDCGNILAFLDQPAVAYSNRLNARATIKYDSYLRAWGKDTIKSNTGNVIHIEHDVHPKNQNILGGWSHHEIVVQLPSAIKSGDRFEIAIAASNRQDSSTNDGAVSALQNSEATVARFYEPEFEPMTDREFDSLGWIKILSIDQISVAIECDLINDVTMRDWGHGIPKKLVLQRKSAR